MMSIIAKGIILIVLLTFFIIEDIFPQASFSIHIESQHYELINSADNDNVGNTILAGAIYSFSKSELDAGLILKVYPDGSYIQNIVSLADTSVILKSVKVLENGNYFFISNIKIHSVPPVYSMGVHIFDTALNLITSKKFLLPQGYSGLSINNTNSILEDNSGNIVLATSLEYEQGTSTFEDFAFYKFNQQGDTLVSKIYETSFEAIVQSLSKVPNSDNLMVISDGYLLFTSGELLFLDPDLNILKVNQLRGGDFYDTKYWLSDSTFIMSETFVKHTPGLPQERMIRVSIMDTSAKYLKSTELDHKDTLDYVCYIESMSCFDDTTIYIGGFQSHHDLTFSSPNVAYLYILDSNLYIRGYKALGGDHCYILEGIIRTMDGGCILWAKKYNVPNLGNLVDIVIWKVMPEDMILYTRVSYLPPGRIQGHAWPNPVDDEIYISLDAFAQGETIYYRITDMQGRTCLHLKQIITGNCLHTQTQNLEPGMYIYEITGQNNKTISGKFIKN